MGTAYCGDDPDPADRGGGDADWSSVYQRPLRGERREPHGSRSGDVDLLSILGFLALFFAVMLRREETGPNAHGLETITASSSSD